MRKLRPRFAEQFSQFLRILAEENRIEVLAIHVRVGTPGGLAILAAFGRCVLRLDVDDDPDRILSDRSIRSHRCSVGTQQVV